MTLTVWVCEDCDTEIWVIMENMKIAFEMVCGRCGGKAYILVGTMEGEKV